MTGLVGMRESQWVGECQISAQRVQVLLMVASSKTVFFNIFLGIKVDSFLSTFGQFSQSKAIVLGISNKLH